MVFIVLFVISGAIALPLFFRSFYYAHVGWLDIPEKTGYTEEEAREAFDEMMDYCMGKSDEFGTGKLAWSEEGKSHFDDCKKLFDLDKVLLVVSAIGIGVCAAVGAGGRTLSSKNETAAATRKAGSAGGSPGFFAGLIMLVGGAVLGALGAKDFDAFFVKFHHTFFPGKENWLFDPATDEIIKILPEEFFRNCAILIVSVIVLVSVALIVVDVLKRRRGSAHE